MKLFVPCIIAVGFAMTSLAHAADLTIDIGGLKNAKGRVLVAAYSRAEDFLKRPVGTAAVDARPGKVRAVIANLPAGDYALSAFQDENGSGELATNPVGMPIEPYGFGNDAVGQFGPPSFEQSRVHLSAAGNTVTINLH
ncbi:MAG: DUF2141 domain-containing protein [Burkholderiales bacterium]|nr:DUF2141 domain-containing protein [Burkholderiales bacterium]